MVICQRGQGSVHVPVSKLNNQRCASKAENRILVMVFRNERKNRGTDSRQQQVSFSGTITRTNTSDHQCSEGFDRLADCWFYQADVTLE